MRKMEMPDWVYEAALYFVCGIAWHLSDRVVSHVEERVFREEEPEKKPVRRKKRVKKPVVDAVFKEIV